MREFYHAAGFSISDDVIEAAPGMDRVREFQ
ncbi:hypothetical protein EV286_109352 [Rhizobium sp. BK251]|nr:hypothetical protein EV286_109352 [Rhizobium sp. BK251]